MRARRLIYAKEVRDDGSIVEIVVWELPEPVPPCAHRYKYRLFFGSARSTRVRYDNERGKGDHRHAGRRGEPDGFTSVERLLEDFARDVAEWGNSK
jgi:hypothetical protein